MFNFFRKTTSAVPAEADRPSSSNEQLQLRTPSPSVTSAIGTRFQRMDGNIDRSSPLREDHVGGPPDTPSPPSHTLDNELGLITDPSALYELISSVPAKTLHEYTLTHLIPPSAESKRGTQQPVLAHIHAPSSITLTHLTSFFSSLTPPPRLHCVRCHKFYYDVENTNRSCLVAHDDESAEVERVGVGKGDSGTQYETLWGCCGKTVEGDGDMGPPDGWCYEGKHTTDTKRARFRADSTIHDDKLASCKRLKCSEPKKQVEDDDSSDASSDRPSRSRPRKRRATATSGTTTSAAAASRKRARKADDDGEQEREQVEAEVEEDPNFTSPGSPGKGKGKGKGKGQAEVDDEAQGKASPSLAASTVKKQRQRKKRPRTTEDDKAFKPEGTPLGDELDDMDVDMDETASVASKSKRKPRTKNPTNPKTKSKSITRKETMVSDAAEAPAGSAPMSPPKSISVPGSPTLSVRAGGAKGSKSAAKPKSSIGGPVRKTKKLDEVIASSIDGEL
ncbi:hypothetical protein E1B28_004839 [Marasmius oreades]|uniref:Uncharacterized protein n=1 Tax=Marasmius oreades TaxID=181124 RepID=A0A9P8ADD9_9AGAR|nr:uncharacterized protein E1B28_004839 [Marasmius oreades]KAG7097497.1 hypothetical protein E1B28_004839 [Marasmius oreades]